METRKSIRRESGTETRRIVNLLCEDEIRMEIRDELGRAGDIWVLLQLIEGDDGQSAAGRRIMRPRKIVRQNREQENGGDGTPSNARQRQAPIKAQHCDDERRQADLRRYVLRDLMAPVETARANAQRSNCADLSASPPHVAQPANSVRVVSSG